MVTNHSKPVKKPTSSLLFTATTGAAVCGALVGLAVLAVANMRQQPAKVIVVQPVAPISNGAAASPEHVSPEDLSRSNESLIRVQPISKTAASPKDTEPTIVENNSPANPYRSTSYAETLLAVMRPAPEGIEPLSEEHFQYSNQEKFNSYLQSTVVPQDGFVTLTKAQQEAMQAAPNPYRELKNNGSIATLVDLSSAPDAETAEQIVAQYQAQRRAKYLNSVVVLPRQ